MDVASGTMRSDRPKLLLVEDDAAVRRSLQLLLQARGFDVRAYASGHSLLADESADSAVGFIADYRMDDLDGLAVLASLRAQGWDGPAILITAYSTPALVEQARQAGFLEVIEKPFRHPALVETVARLLDM